ncbi:MAG TPA: hypothetical protein VGP19_03325 [Candidatus Acidoferrales bacterium]|nr:hypothetical protein [Candidatus Acidoferrales bacterium]
MHLRPAFPATQSVDRRLDESWPLRRKTTDLRVVRSLAYFGAMMVFVPASFAQTGNAPGKPQTPAAGPASAPALSHDLSGVWMPYSTHMDGIDEKLRPPLTPWGQARFDASVPLVGPRAIAGQENNPALHCEPEAVPKSLVLPNPFEIIQIPGRMFMLFEQYHLWRTIWADGRPLPKDPDPSFLGYSVGTWEGDTFVVETIGMNDKPWVDSYGNPRSERMHLKERYRRLDHDTLEMQIIMDDPKAYTEPWVNPPQRFKLEPGWEIAEFFCVVDEENSYGDAVRKPAGVAPATK